MDTNRFPQIIKQIYGAVAELERMFPGRHFTPDGHMVGSIGEALAAHYYGLTLNPASTKGFDAVKDGKKIEIKATQGNRVAFRSCPEYALVLRIDESGQFEEVFNGPGHIVWQEFAGKTVPSNGQFQISLKKLAALNLLVADTERVKREVP